MRLLKIFIIILACSIFVQAQVNKKALQSYPLTFNLTWGGGNWWWDGQFGWNMSVFPDTNLIKRMRDSLGSKMDSIYFSITSDWNQGEPIIQLQCIDTLGWALRSANGAPCDLNFGGRLLMDITDYCPRTARAPYYNRRYNEFLPDTIGHIVNPTYIDGINSDGSWEKPLWWLGTDATGVDIDRDGYPDRGEYDALGHTSPTYHPIGDLKHGINDAQAFNWIDSVWAAGYNHAIQRLRSNTNWTNKLFSFWSVKDSMAMSWANGGGWENFPQNAPVTYDLPFPNATSRGYNHFQQIADSWNAVTTRQPRMMYVAASMADQIGNPNCPTPFWTQSKRWYRWMRWTLGMAIVSDAYYKLQDGDGNQGTYDHITSFYYDEYKANLGRPVVNGLHHIRIGTVYVKFFTNGCFIGYYPQTKNLTASVTITNAEISSLTGYNGPYYRMYGNQDTTWNNGEAFNSVTLTCVPGINRCEQAIGDAIILKRSRDTVTCDIIVDNSGYGTIPGSEPATFTSGFVWDNGTISNDYARDYNPTYNTGYRASTGWITDRYDWMRSRYCQNQGGQSGLGSQIATYIPTLNRAGWYRVYEWHGWMGEMEATYSEATNVPFRINYQTGFKDTTINQRVGFGKWNLLGTYYFTPTGSKSVQIGNNTATGYVIADAIRFEFLHGTSAIIEPPPPPPLPDSSFQRKPLVKRRGTP